MTNSPEARLLFEIFDAKPRTKRLRSAVTWLYDHAERLQARRHRDGLACIVDRLGDHIEDFAIWDLNRQYRRHLKDKRHDRPRR